MRLLLDTHYLFWMAVSPERIRDREREVVDDSAHELFASPISIMELRIKWQLRARDGRRRSEVHPEQVLGYIERGPITLVPLTGADCATVLDVPLQHRDPFDEQLLIHAQRLDATLFTRDRLLAGHPLVYRFA